MVTMRITQYSDYALRTLIYLAVMPSSHALANVQDIADSYGISKHHLVKIVHSLSRMGLIDTMRGKNGGIRLAMPPKDINLGVVLRHTEADFALVDCFLPKKTDTDRGISSSYSRMDTETPILDSKHRWSIPVNAEQWADSAAELPAVSGCVISPVCQLKPVFFEAIQAFLAIFDRYTLADVLHNPDELRQLLGK